MLSIIFSKSSSSGSINKDAPGSILSSKKSEEDCNGRSTI